MADLFKDSGDATNGYLTFVTDNGGSVRVLFQHIPENLSDSRKANYEVKEIAKRTEPLLIYQATGFREISFSLRFGARTAQEAYDLYGLANLLRRSVFPTAVGIPQPCKLYLGPFFIYHKVVPSGNGVTLERDTSYSEDENGMNCVIRDYSITPSDKRLNHPEIQNGLPGTPQNWWVKVPSEVNISIGLYVFLGQVWSTGNMLCATSASNPNAQGTSQTQSSGSQCPNSDTGTDATGPSAQSGDPQEAGDMPSPTSPPSSLTGGPPTQGTVTGTGEVSSYTDENGNTINTEMYTAEDGSTAGELKTTTYPDGSSSSSYTDFNSGVVQTTSYDSAGNITGQTSNTDQGGGGSQPAGGSWGGG